MPKPVLFLIVSLLVASVAAGEGTSFWLAFGITYAALMIPMSIWVGIRTTHELNAYRRLLVASLKTSITIGPAEHSLTGVFKHGTVHEAAMRGAIQRVSPYVDEYVLTEKGRPVAEEWRAKYSGRI